MVFVNDLKICSFSSLKHFPPDKSGYFKADAPIEMGTDLRVESSYARGTPPVNVGASHSIDTDEVYTGLRAQDLQEAKDQLVVETADMLHIPLFTAEALLRDNGAWLDTPYFFTLPNFLFNIFRMVSGTAT